MPGTKRVKAILYLPFFFYLLSVPAFPHSPFPLNIQPFPMDSPIPSVQVMVYQLRPPLKAEWQRTVLPQLIQRPTLVLYGLIGDPQSERSAEELFELAKGWKKLSALVIFRATDEGEFQRVRSWVESRHPSIPVAVDTTLGIAFGLMAFKLPSYAILDKGGILRVRRIRGLDYKLLNQKTLRETISAIEKGAPIPLSDGEYIEDTRSLLGKKAPEIKFLPSSLNFAPKNPFDLRFPQTKPTLIVFWMATCPHCQKEMPRLTQWWRSRKDQVQLITATRTQAPNLRDITRSYLEERNLTDLPVYEASDAHFSAFRVEGIPTWLMVNKEGEIVEVQIGEDERLFDHLDQALKKCK